MISADDLAYLQVLAHQEQQAMLALQNARAAKLSFSAHLTAKYELQGEDQVMTDGTIVRGGPDLSFGIGEPNPMGEPATNGHVPEDTHTVPVGTER